MDNTIFSFQWLLFSYIDCLAGAGNCPACPVTCYPNNLVVVVQGLVEDWYIRTGCPLEYTGFTAAGRSCLLYLFTGWVGGTYFRRSTGIHHPLKL